MSKNKTETIAGMVIPTLAVPTKHFHPYPYCSERGEDHPVCSDRFQLKRNKPQNLGVWRPAHLVLVKGCEWVKDLPYFQCGCCNTKIKSFEEEGVFLTEKPLPGSHKLPKIALAHISLATLGCALRGLKYIFDNSVPTSDVSTPLCGAKPEEHKLGPWFWSGRVVDVPTSDACPACKKIFMETMRKNPDAYFHNELKLEESYGKL